MTKRNREESEVSDSSNESLGSLQPLNNSPSSGSEISNSNSESEISDSELELEILQSNESLEPRLQQLINPSLKDLEERLAPYIDLYVETDGESSSTSNPSSPSSSPRNSWNSGNLSNEQGRSQSSNKR